MPGNWKEGASSTNLSGCCKQCPSPRRTGQLSTGRLPKRPTVDVLMYVTAKRCHKKDGSDYYVVNDSILTLTQLDDSESTVHRLARISNG